MQQQPSICFSWYNSAHTHTAEPEGSFPLLIPLSVADMSESVYWREGDKNRDTSGLNIYQSSPARAAQTAVWSWLAEELFSRTWRMLTAVTMRALPWQPASGVIVPIPEPLAAGHHLLRVHTGGASRWSGALGFRLLWLIHNIPIQINRKRLLVVSCLPLHLLGAGLCLPELLHRFNPATTP